MNVGGYCAAGCGAWSSGAFQWRGRLSRTCSGCMRYQERSRLVRDRRVPARDVNAVGLGNRRGLAIEESRTLPKTGFIVYVDGSEVFRRPTWERAYLDGVSRMMGVRA